MTRNQRVTASGVRRPQSERLRRRRRWYFALMGVCLALGLLAWKLVRLWSTTAAVAMSVVAAMLPPIAVLITSVAVLMYPRRSRGQPDAGDSAPAPEHDRG